MTLISDVEAALPDEYMRATDIQEKMGMRAPGLKILKDCLNELSSLGIADRLEGKFITGFTTYFYRRARLPQQRAA